jgi:uncharacterized membrane protein HdeD (DUF308 family)
MERYEVLILIVGILSVLLGLVIAFKPKVLPYLVSVYFIGAGILWIIRALV